MLLREWAADWIARAYRDCKKQWVSIDNPVSNLAVTLTCKTTERAEAKRKEKMSARS